MALHLHGDDPGLEAPALGAALKDSSTARKGSRLSCSETVPFLHHLSSAQLSLKYLAQFSLVACLVLRLHGQLC